MVFTTFFGDDNYMWEVAKREEVILTVTDGDLFPYWERGDRDGFVSHAGEHKFTRTGVRPARNVASRWYGYMDRIMNSAGDTWLHYDGQYLWWTVSGLDAGTVDLDGPRSPKDRGIPVCVLKKGARAWSNQNTNGNPLEWKSLHAKAKDFLVPQGTQARLSADNAAYALALIGGRDLSPWHSRDDWKRKLDSRSQQQPGHIFNDRQKSIVEMVRSVTRTTENSNGQEVTRVLKNKDLLMSETELERYIEELLDQQEDRCAISDLPLQFTGTHVDKEMLCSLDRIDSSLHYERGNLQILCRFINRWKSDATDSEFRRLIATLRTGVEERV